jgi:lipopolysaccharide transport system ATP-binding protein
VADLRIAMVGTPDAANYGDLLFPLIAEHELRARLGEIELVSYGYRDVGASGWPFAVRSVGALPREISGYDLLLVGGGLLIRDDAALADGYAPSDQSVNQPLGLWLTPTLLAHAAGVPVVWNAVGAASQFAPWLGPMMRAAIKGCAYVAVRDQASADTLARIVPDAQLHVVPDTAFGAQVLVDEDAKQALQRTLESAGIGDRRYVVVQSTTGLSAVGSAIEEALVAARAQDAVVLEIPIGPILGDHTGAFPIGGHVATLDHWPSPQVLTALLAGAEAIIHQSLHAGVVGFGAGVPCLRRPMPGGGKHDQLNGLPGVHLLGQNGAAGVLGVPRVADATADAIRNSIRGALDAYWDKVAGVAGRRDPHASGAMLDLISELPGMGQKAAAEVAALEGQLVHQAEYKAAYRAFAYRVEELAGGVAGNLGDTAELAYLRKRDATLQRVLDGGWWQLRNRLQPLLRLARKR